MGKPTQAPFGSWKSPLTSSLIVSETLQLSQIHLDGETLYWIENRPLEGGRNVIVQLSQTGEPISLTPTPFNVRSRVHEYGGGAYLVDNGVIYFSNFSDQRLYRHKADSKPQALTPEGQFYYADGVIDSQHNRIICIREDHSDSSREPVNSFISISLENPIQENAGQILASGCDFYSSPKISPDSRQLAWVSWNHPNMPWDGTQLWKANIELDGTLGKPECMAGGPQESIFQPEWSPDGTLFFISDRTGWWNLYRIRNGVSEALCPMEAEFGKPQWSLGLTTYTFESARTILCTYTKNGIWFLCRLDIECRTLETFPLPYTEIGGPVYLNGSTICTASSPSEPNVIIQIDLASYDIHILRRSINFSVEPHYLSIPQEIEFPTERGQTAHAFFYKPQNGDFSPPSGVKAPLLVKSHGGPTGSASTAFNLMIQYWMSRGFAVLDVNYGGSTGYGQAYRERLNGQWGIVDVDDCVNGVRYVIKQGWVDDQKLTITGGSAGGYTTLSALTFRDCFTAGSSYYGVSDLQALVRDTHKFESRYLDRLIGPLPEKQQLYKERSPINFTHQLSCPLIFFQGLEDKVVPPNQAQMMFNAVKAKGLPVAYLAFEGEQHGFRQAPNIKKVLDSELYFYSKIFGFEPADPVEPVTIENLP